MKHVAPYLFGGFGIAMIVFSVVLRNGTNDADLVITNLASSFMVFAGSVCLLVGVITFFRRHDQEEWYLGIRKNEQGRSRDGL
jgi:hypothetical protein